MTTESDSTGFDDFTDVDLNDEIIDPRIQIELEKLNCATDTINKLELEIDDARNDFRQLLSDSSHQIDALSKKLGSSIEKARPYYEARLEAKKLAAETHKAAVNFERANSAHCAAKEMVFLAEEGLVADNRTFDPAWQEMMNHATTRVNEAEKERAFSELAHKHMSQAYMTAEETVHKYQKDLKKVVNKSSMTIRRNLLQINNLAYQYQLVLRPYYEMRAQFNQMLEEKKKKVKELEVSITAMKKQYSQALRSLEDISDEIHRRREKEERTNLRIEPRLSCVGADSPLSRGSSGDYHITSDSEYDSSSPDTSTSHWADEAERYHTLPKSFSATYIVNRGLKTADLRGKLSRPKLPRSLSIPSRLVIKSETACQTDDLPTQPKTRKPVEPTAKVAPLLPELIEESSDTVSENGSLSSDFIADDQITNYLFMEQADIVDDSRPAGAPKLGRSFSLCQAYSVGLVKDDQRDVETSNIGVQADVGSVANGGSGVPRHGDPGVIAVQVGPNRDDVVLLTPKKRSYSLGGRAVLSNH